MTSGFPGEMDSVEKQGSAGPGPDVRRKRKANAAGIQTQNKESAAPGSAERAAAKQAEQSTSVTTGVTEHKKRVDSMMNDLDEIMKLPNPHVAVIAHVADVVLAMGAAVDASGTLSSNESHKEFHTQIKAHADRAKEVLGKAVKQKIDQTTNDSTVHLPRIVNFMSTPQHNTIFTHEAFVPLTVEVARRAAEACSKLALMYDGSTKTKTKATAGLLDGLRQVLETVNAKETKVHRAVANAFLALDGHDIFFEKITKDLAFINASGKDKTPRADVENAMKSLKRDVRMFADISKHDSDNARMLTKAGIGIDLVPLLGLKEKKNLAWLEEQKPYFTGAIVVEKEVCHVLSQICAHIADREENQESVVDAGAIPALIKILSRPPPPAVAGLSAESRRAAESHAAASHELARRAADALSKLVHDSEAHKRMVRDEDGVPTLRALLDRRDTKVQRAAAAALLTLGEHDRLVKEIEATTEKLVARPDADRARDALKTAVRTLAELAKEGQTVNTEGDMVDAVVRSGAVEAIVPLLSLSQRVGEEYDVSFGDIEKEASYAISLMASKDVNQNRIAAAGALPGLVALLQRYPPQTTGSVATSVARRAADAVTNLAHENNAIKNHVRTEGGIPPLVSLLETKDPKVKRAAASALRTLAFKNDDNKNQIVECGALPMLIFMVKSDDQLIHYEAVGVIGNLVHSSTHIKRRVLDEGALQPVIGLLSSECPESQREAALLLGQFATTDSFKVKMVQRGAIRPLIHMLGNTDEQLREMAAFALGRLAQDADNQVGILHADGLRPLLDLLDCDKGNLQHNAAFALYGLADNEDNVPDIVREGTVQRLMGRELIVQASKDCVKKTLDRLKGKIASSARVLRYLIYLMTTDPDSADAQRIAVALCHLVDDAVGEELREVFIKKLGLPILLRMLMPVPHAKQGAKFSSQYPETCHALHVLLTKVAAKLPAEDAPLPPTPEAYLDEHFNTPELSDISFIVNGEEFFAHKIAFTHCPISFHEELDARKTSKPGERLVCDFSHTKLTADVFRALMRFMYVSTLDPERPDIASDLMQVAVAYDMHELKRRCEALLCDDVRLKGEAFEAKDVVDMFEKAEALDATSVSIKCALHTLEHHHMMLNQLGAQKFGQLTGKMVTRIDEHARAMFHRLPTSVGGDGQTRLTV